MSLRESGESFLMLGDRLITWASGLSTYSFPGKKEGQFFNLCSKPFYKGVTRRPIRVGNSVREFPISSIIHEFQNEKPTFRGRIGRSYEGKGVPEGFPFATYADLATKPTPEYYAPSNFLTWLAYRHHPDLAHFMGEIGRVIIPERGYKKTSKIS